MRFSTEISSDACIQLRCCQQAALLLDSLKLAANVGTRSILPAWWKAIAGLGAMTRHWQLYLVSISKGKTCHVILVFKFRLGLRSIIFWDMSVELLQQDRILISPSMKVKDSHEDIFVVGQVGHSLDVLKMGML